MKRLLVSIFLIIILQSCATTTPSTNVSFSIHSKTPDYILFDIGTRYNTRDFRTNSQLISAAKNHCSSFKKNTYYFFKHPNPIPFNLNATQRELTVYYASKEFVDDIVLNGRRWLIVVACANSVEEAKINRPSKNYERRGSPYCSYMQDCHRGQWQATEYKRKLTDVEVAENKRIENEKEQKRLALAKKKNDEFLIKIENLYGSKCAGSFINKKFEKGTKEYNNCLLEKDKIAKLNAQKERERLAQIKAEKDRSIAAEQAALDRKLSKMSSKERHAYNCSEVFKFRKGSSKFNDCVFELYTAELDLKKLELEKQVAEAKAKAAANEQARAEAVANAQIAAAKAAKKSADLNRSLQLMQMGSSMLGGSSSSSSSNDSFGIQNRVRTTCRNVGGFINCY